MPQERSQHHWPGASRSPATRVCPSSNLTPPSPPHRLPQRMQAEFGEARSFTLAINSAGPYHALPPCASTHISLLRLLGLAHLPFSSFPNTLSPTIHPHNTSTPLGEKRGLVPEELWLEHLPNLWRSRNIAKKALRAAASKSPRGSRASSDAPAPVKHVRCPLAPTGQLCTLLSRLICSPPLPFILPLGCRRPAERSPLAARRRCGRSAGR